MILNSDFDEALEDLNSQPTKQMYSTNDLENIVNSILSTLPKLDRNAYRREMLNEGLSLAQGYKDRLSEIYNLANAEYRLRKRTKEMLFDALSVLSKASSADKRNGECVMKYPLTVLNLEAAEIFVDEVEQIMGNVKSAMEATSRQISVIGLQISLNDIKRGNQSEAQEINYSSNQNKKRGELADWNEVG